MLRSLAEPGDASRKRAPSAVWPYLKRTAASFLGVRYTLYLCNARTACIWGYGNTGTGTCMAVHFLSSLLRYKPPFMANRKSQATPSHGWPVCPIPAVRCSTP